MYSIIKRTLNVFQMTTVGTNTSTATWWCRRVCVCTTTTGRPAACPARACPTGPRGSEAGDSHPALGLLVFGRPSPWTSSGSPHSPELHTPAPRDGLRGWAAHRLIMPTPMEDPDAGRTLGLFIQRQETMIEQLT